MSSSNQGLWPLTPTAGLALAQAWLAGDANRLPIGQRLSFDLLVWQAQTLQARLGNLALNHNHPRAWTRLPLDSTLYRLESGMPFRPPLSLLDQEAGTPRFPLAGASSPASAYLPLGMTTRPDPERALFPLPQTSTRLEQDGLDPFSAGLGRRLRDCR